MSNFEMICLHILVSSDYDSLKGKVAPVDMMGLTLVY